MDAKAADHRKSKRDLRYAESQLRNLNTKIDKLLNKLDEKEQDEAKTPEEECVICVNSKATMQTWPCGHRVVCRKCLVRTIQIAVSRRSLPLRCVVCRARVLRLKRSSDGRAASTPSATAGHRNAAAVAIATSTRSRSLPTKLRRHMSTATVAVRSRSVGTGKAVDRRQSANCGGRRKRCNYAGTAAGWAEAFATDQDAGGGDDDDDVDDDHDDDDDDDHDNHDDDDDDEDEDYRVRHTSAVKYSKLDSSTADLRRDNQSKNGLQRILGKFKFWRFLRFKNNKP